MTRPRFIELDPILDEAVSDPPEVSPVPPNEGRVAAQARTPSLSAAVYRSKKETPVAVEDGFYAVVRSEVPIVMPIATGTLLIISGSSILVEDESSIPHTE